MGLLDILNQVVGGNNANIAQGFDQVAQAANPSQLSQGLAAAFRSDQTPAFGNMVGQLFGQSNPNQQAGVLNQILATVGPGVLAAAAGGVLGKVMSPGATQITPDQASQLTPEQVQEIAAHAEQAHPGAVDAVSQFYAQHSGLIKVLGGAALAVAMAKLKDHVESTS